MRFAAKKSRNVSFRHTKKARIKTDDTAKFVKIPPMCMASSAFRGSSFSGIFMSAERGKSAMLFGGNPRIIIKIRCPSS